MNKLIEELREMKWYTLPAIPYYEVMGVEKDGHYIRAKEENIANIFTQFIDSEIERLDNDEMVEYYRGFQEGTAVEYDKGYLDAIEDQITHLGSIKQELL